ncbi:ABC transporter [Microbacterium sp. Root166]|nr:ABC transporter [Microbacterium sp. Root166]
MPNDIDPDEPERHDSAPVVSLSASAAKQTTDARTAPRKPPSKKGSSAGKATRPAAAQPVPVKREAIADPGPPPPLPADLTRSAPAEPELVIPPMPPLPPVQETPVQETPVEVTPVEETPVEVTPVEVPPVEEAPVEQPPIVVPVPDVPIVPAAVVEDLPLPVLPATATAGDVLVLRGVAKRFGDTHAVDSIDLTVPAGTFYGLVGPNGAGKTTTLSMIAGLLEPDRGTISVGGIDAARHPHQAKRLMGVLPDRLRTFDRLTGRQLLYYYGVLRGLKPAVVESRTADLARAFDLTDALGRVVSDYSAGMAKKVMLAGAMIHSPRLLVLDEPFESVDPVSSAVILDILSAYVAHGGTVILSSHGMELVQRVCSRVAVIVAGQVLAEGTVDAVRGELSLEQRFIELAGGLSDVEGLEWLHTFSD